MSVQQKVGTAHSMVWVVARWLPLAVLTGLPISMAPLSLLFLGYAAFGDFGAGTLLVSLFVVGELIGSLTLGIVVKGSTLRSRLFIGYLLSGMAFAGLAIAGTTQQWWLWVLAFVAGFAPAASLGTLQAFLLGNVAEGQVPRVMILARTQSTLVFIAGPALAGILQFANLTWAAPALAALALLSASGVVLFVRTPSAIAPRTQPLRRSLSAVVSVWPIYAVGFSATFVVGLIELVLAPLFAERGADPGWAGLVAALFFASGLLGTLVYGARKSWGASFAVQGFVVTLFIVAGLLLAALAIEPLYIAIGALLAGAGVAILLMIRTLSLRRLLAKELHSAAFSINYAMSCSSYLLCALVGGLSLANASASGALLIGAATVLALSIVGSLFEANRERRDIGVESEVR